MYPYALQSVCGLFFKVGLGAQGVGFYADMGYRWGRVRAELGRE